MTESEAKSAVLAAYPNARILSSHWNMNRKFLVTDDLVLSNGYTDAANCWIEAAKFLKAKLNRPT